MMRQLGVRHSMSIAACLTMLCCAAAWADVGFAAEAAPIRTAGGLLIDQSAEKGGWNVWSIGQLGGYTRLDRAG